MRARHIHKRWRRLCLALALIIGVQTAVSFSAADALFPETSAMHALHAMSHAANAAKAATGHMRGAQLHGRAAAYPPDADDAESNGCLGDHSAPCIACTGAVESVQPAPLMAGLSYAMAELTAAMIGALNALWRPPRSLS